MDTVQWRQTEGTVIGTRGGYRIWNPDRQFVIKNNTHVIYSDDKGKTWQDTEKPIDTSILDWTAGHSFMELADGTVVLIVYGCHTEKDTRMRLDCCGVFRSTDQGESWGDFSFVAYDKKDRRMAYSEIGIAPITDKLWVAFMRTEPRGTGGFYSWMSRAISTNVGHTWSPPELCFTNSEPEVAILPDGGLAVQHSHGMRFTYDLGRTWTRTIPCDGYPKRTVLLDDNTLLSGSGPLWKRIPAGKK